jgi:hypothetical protein
MKMEDEGRHSYIVIIDFEGELRMLEDWLINPRIDKEEYNIVSSTKCSKMLSYIIEEDRWRYGEE